MLTQRDLAAEFAALAPEAQQQLLGLSQLVAGMSVPERAIAAQTIAGVGQVTATFMVGALIAEAAPTADLCGQVVAFLFCDVTGEEATRDGD